MIADLDARCGQAYVRESELLPARGAATSNADAFAGSRERFEELVGWLSGSDAGAVCHGDLESRLEAEGRELLCRLAQDHLDLRAQRERRIEEVTDADGVRHRSVERGHERSLQTVFGELRVRRLAYRSRGRCNLYPADATLNLPVEKHSHGLRRLAAIESSRGSFGDAQQAIERATGQRIGKRQIEELAALSAVDFDAFYQQRGPAAAGAGDTLVISCDGKGVVMRPDALRPATRRQAARAQGKLRTRLSKGEKRNRKRIAEVGCVYDAALEPRTAADILPATDAERQTARPGPAAQGKWLTASVTDDAAQVVCDVFDEGERRDRGHERDWVALVDGNNHQIDRIKAEANRREIDIAIICDFVHVLEYLWTAAWCFHREGDPAAETWVRRHAQRVLEGNATRVAGAIRRQATNAGLDLAKRKGADDCARYLTNKAPYLDYPRALMAGWPIATGVIEGACRHLVKDRLDLTGARWGLDGAEAILKLRAICANGDFNEYWRFHLDQEHQHFHRSHYAGEVIPAT